LSSEVIDIRRLAADDFAALLDAEGRAWSERMRWDYAPAARVIRACLADRRLNGYALVNGGSVEGYSFYVCENDKGLIGDCFMADPAAASNSLFRLLGHVLEALMAWPGVRRIESQLPHFSAETLEPCFTRHGFRTYLRRFMLLNLNGGHAEIPDSAAAAETLRSGQFVIQPWERKHDQQAVDLICQAYRGHIDAAINDQYASASGASRLIENIVELRGCGEQVPRASLIAIHAPTRRLAGVVALTGVRRQTAHIPQVAVAPEFQSHGLGAALLATAFREAVRRGYREVSLTVTDLNRRAVSFYERLGFETFRTFGAYVWNSLRNDEP
jgi:ribosomal protein S18 acetylase RimI-like enzyme